MDQKYIRNFSIIAHIDHGKSTLADRILEMTKTVQSRDMVNQVLDDLDLERERGITIKLNAVSLTYDAEDGNSYLLHLIDTPGHVDFTYEVSRSLAACEGAVLVVDASQGVEAQTLANVYLAIDNNLEVIPVINKIDLPGAMIDYVKEEIENDIGLDTTDVPLISAKTGLNIKDVLESIVKKIPAPGGDLKAPLQALIFDSYYDSYRGVIAAVRIKNGILKVGDNIKFMSSGNSYSVTEVGIRSPKEINKQFLQCGEVGWLAASIKSVKDVRVGDTITTVDNPCKEPLPGYKQLLPMVYCGFYPTDNGRYNDLRDALEKLQLNDASLVFEAETSQALGFGFRCGFLGLLHMDVVQERLEREYNLDLIATAPSVIYEVKLTSGETLKIDNPALVPASQYVEKISEPFVNAKIMSPTDYIGPIMELCQKKRGTYKDIIYLDDKRVIIIYELPLSEIVFDFFDRLKSATKGYASLDYELIEYRSSRLQRMDILINGEVIDALASIVHSDFAYQRGSNITRRLKELIPSQLFEIPIQAAIGGRVIARTNIKAYRKNVLAKCYGGDISRKKKLLEKQKEGKKRMKYVGEVEIPQEAFMALLSMDEEIK
ncbi:MAG: translation elongation factor 4 [Erysipelotrichaceae bacterium]|jgi:GTP-binding protein LepA